MGLYIEILSYGGSLRITAVTDGRTATEPEVLRECLEGVYEDLNVEVCARVNGRRHGEGGGGDASSAGVYAGECVNLRVYCSSPGSYCTLVIAIVLS